uniref:hypothetical protein n=1 Tax=Thiomicrorhabdus cannonii TaxID=2748011 RepID=UPI001C4B3AD1
VLGKPLIIISFEPGCQQFFQIIFSNFSIQNSSNPLLITPATRHSTSQSASRREEVRIMSKLRISVNSFSKKINKSFRLTLPLNFYYAFLLQLEHPKAR